MFVVVFVPAVLARVSALDVKDACVSANVPAIQISKYCVKPLFTSSPQLPDSVPVVIIGNDNSDVGVIAMSYSVKIVFQLGFWALLIFCHEGVWLSSIKLQ